MRRRLTGLAVATLVAVAAAACSGNPPPPPPAACATASHPAIALAIRLKGPPSRTRGLCIARRYDAVFARARGWGGLARVMRAESPNLQLWDERSLLYACDGCAAGVFSIAWVRANHPEWIVHTADGAEVHPRAHPGWVLLDFTSLDYLSAWGARMVGLLDHDGFTGVDVIDATNDPGWDGVPVVQNADVTRRALDERARRFQLGKALTLARDQVKPHGYLLAAENGPPEDVLTGQINSTDAVSVGEGFAHLSGEEWSTLFHYFHRVFRERVGAVVWDEQGPLTRAARVYGLASYLLVAATPVAAYGVNADPADPLYGVSLGEPSDGEPVQDGEVWTRTYANGSVAVNPGLVPASLKIGGFGRVDLPPASAVIQNGDHLIKSS